MEKSSDMSRPHVLALAFPAQSHLTAMMYLARQLAARGILVTFVTTEYFLQQMLQAAGQDPASSAEIEGIKLLGLDDGLPEDDPRLPTCVDTLHAFESLGGHLEVLLQAGGLSPPVTCFVSDSFLPWTQAIALKYGVPRALFWTQSLAVCAWYWCTSKLVSSGFDPFLQRVRYRGERPLIGFIPGLPDMDPYDLPFNTRIQFLEASENIKWLRSHVESQFSTTVKDVTWFIANSSEDLEGPIAQALCSASLIPSHKLLLLGPLCNDLPLSEYVSLSRASLWRDADDGSLSWLDTQLDRSILYISFGSIVARADVVSDIAMALLACKQPFLWARQSGWEDVRDSLSHDFLEFTAEAGKLTAWVPQLKILSHRAIGGFFTHAGWSSTMESISRGVPMVAWPSFLDQYTNSWAISCLWKIGVQVMAEEGSDVVQELQGAICTLMRGPASSTFRERVAELARASAGSSDCKHFRLFVDDMFKRAAIVAAAAAQV